MINEEDAMKLKQVLQNMNNCETSLEHFCEILDKESLGQLTFSMLKNSLDKNYAFISKNDRLFLLKHVNLEKSGLINIYELFEFFSRILGKPIYSPILAFYLAANIIEKRYKIKTLEFIYKIGLSLERELNANDFFNLICENLKVDESTSLIIFKGLDYKKKGLVKVEDFVIVVDSYRDDTVEDSFIPERINISNHNQENINVEKREIEYFRDTLENNYLTVEEIYRKINENNIEYANHVDLYKMISELLGDKVNDMFLRKILGFLRNDDKIYRCDLENLLVFKLDFKSKDIIDSNSLIKLNDVQIYWINKFTSLLDSIGVTPISAFNISVQDKITKDKISLDIFKKKLKLIFPGGKVTAQDITNIADSLDINKTKLLTIQEYNEIISISKKEKDLENKKTSSSNKKKINSYVKESRSVNINLLPVRGNHKVISQLKIEINRKYNSYIGSNQNTFLGKNESKMKDNTIGSFTNQLSNPVQLRDETFNPTEATAKQEHDQKSNKSEMLINPSPKIKQNINENEINSFISDLDVFEGGEWKFFEILEEKINFETYSGHVTIYNILNELKNTFCPLIPKAKIFEVLKAIDQDKDGYCNIKEIIKFLLKFFKHKSTKLSLKEIARKLEFDLNCSTEEFFETKQLKIDSEMAFVYFTQFFINYFEIEPPVIKKIYEDMKIKNNKQNILVADVVDMINEYRTDVQNKNINKLSLNSNGGEYSGLGILDKKSFETELKSFVKGLTNNFGHKLKENLNVGLSLTKTMNLMYFRENFVNKLNMDLALGITTFQLLKNFSHKDEQIITKDDLFMFLESYVTLEDTEESTSIENIIGNLEMIGCPLKIVFEYIKYNPTGYVTTYEVLKALETFYPHFSKKNFMTIIKSIDTYKNGFISYNNLQSFIIKYSKKSSFSLNLEFKRLACLIDSSSSTTTFEFFKNKGVRNYHNIDIDEHRDILKTLISNNEVIEEIFNFLCERSKNSLGYDIQRLIEQIDNFRENHSVYVVDVGEEITKQNQSTITISKFLSDLNEIKTLNSTFDKLNVGEYDQISILEIFKALAFSYPNSDKSKLMNFLKIIDNNSQGFVSYEQFNKTMKRLLPNYEASLLLHSKFLANKILKEHENFIDYLNFKNLNPNSSLNQVDFCDIFKEEFIKDQELCLKVFNNLKEKSGKYIGNIIVQNFIDFISHSSVKKLGKLADLDTEKTSFNKDDLSEPVESILEKLENIRNKPLKILFDHINLKQINQYGKISTDTINSILKEHFPIREELINKFTNFFSTLNTLFDLNKLVEFLQSNSGKSEVSITQIIQKIISTLKQNNDSNLNLFLQKYNLKLYDPYTLIDICMIFPPIFGISLYDCFILTQDMLSISTNTLKEEGKFNLDLFFCHHGLYQIVKPIKKSDQIRIDGYMKITLKSLSDYLEKEKDSLKLFRSFDVNHDGVLSKEEFLNILNNLKDLNLNDYQKIGIIKIADKSRDDNINYPEFLEFLKIIKDDVAFEEKIRKNSEFIEKIDFDLDKLKENVDYNKRNMGEIQKDGFKKSLFVLQEEFYNQFNDFNNIESEFQKLDFSNGEYLISYPNFYSTLEVRFDDFDNYKEKYINFAYEGLDNNMIKKLKSNENMNYKHFLKNLVQFRYAKSKEEISAKKKREGDMKKKEIEDKKKQESKPKKEEKVIDDNDKLAHTSKIFKKESLKAEDDDKKLSATVKLELPPIKENPKDAKKQKLLELRKQKDEERKKILEERRKGETNKIQNMKNPFAKKDDSEEKEEEKKSVNESIGEVIKLGKTQSFRISENVLKDIENKEKFKSLLNMSNNVIKVNIDFNNPEAIEKAQRKLISVFATQKKEEFNKIKQTPEDKLNFLNFVVNINSFIYKGYDYHIDPEKDYFKRPDGKKIETILNSEDAAIKKCEELYNKIPEKEEYFDKDFGPQLNDNGIGNKFSLYINGTCPKGHMDPSLIEWYRMTEISPEKSPQFFDDTIETNDVMQGALGDCWFISALSVIATKDHLLRGQFEYSIVDDGEIDNEENVMLSTGVYPPIFHGFRRKNIFCFRFFKNCRWRYVIIDDRLPCRKVFQKGQTPKLIYARCRNESEFWVPLIEKAYAKLHGSYESLISGFIDDGLVDLTGYVARKMFITPDQIKDKQQCEQLWAMISSSMQISFKLNDGNSKSLKSKMFSLNNSMLGCSVDAKVVESEVIFQGHKSGILAGHAYAVLDAFEVEKKNPRNRKRSRLLRIRNPWGFKEWNGKWSDESEELDVNKEGIEKTLNERYKDKSEQINLNAEDGTFLMCFSDFRQIFNKMFLCVDFPPNTIGIRFYDKWTTAESGGLPINNTPKEFVAWAKNPQYYVKIEKNTTIFISLIQNDGRLTKDKFPFPSITKKACIIVAKADKKKKLVSYDKSEIKNVSSVRQHRENSMQLMLSKGEYIIIPSIFKEGDTGEFNLQLYIDDEFVDENYNENNFLDKMKYTKIERLEPKFNIKKEIIEEELSDFSHVLKRKKEFIYSQFKSLINDPNEIDTYLQHNENKEEKENEDII